MAVFITRREEFSAAHKLYRKDWSEEKNQEIFGNCSNPNWHGHNYSLYVTVKGTPASDTGFVMNLRTLRDLIREHIICKIDHKNLNLDVDFMSDIQTTTENLAVVIWNQLLPHLDAIGVALHCVKLQETLNNSVEYYGDKE